MKIERMTTVYHAQYGKGYILSIKYRYKDSLCMCSFGKGKYDFVTESQLRRGDGDITLTKQRPNGRRSTDPLEQALRNIIGG